MDLCVIYNPAAARGRAGRRIEELRRFLGPGVEFLPTQHPGHAEELAFQAAAAGRGTVAAAGGDGTVHEVANGLLRAARPEVTFGVFPLGSANDYVHSLSIPSASLRGRSATAEPQAVDVGMVRGGNGRERYFVNGLGLGFNGAVAVESRSIRRLQGLPLYGLAFLKALWSHFERPEMEIAFDGETRRTPTLALTVAIGRREGNFVVAPQAQYDDGLFDYLLAGSLSRWEVLRYMPRLASGGQLPAGHPNIRLGRCREVRVRCESPLTVHLDGEFFCLPKDGVRELEVRILPGALKVQVFVGSAPG